MPAKEAKLIGICQLKGGVGATTLTAALGSCWARHGLKVALVDFDDVNPHLSSWAQADQIFRQTVGKVLRRGKILAEDLRTITFPVEGHRGRLVVIPQPSAYHESFHYKADVLKGAASASDFVHALMNSLSAQYDVIVADFGRSWGIATFAALPLCHRVLLVTDDDSVSIARSLESLQRLASESDDSEEFDFRRWLVVLNGYTNRLLTRKDILSKVKAIRLFPEDAHPVIIPFSEPGRDWGRPGVSFHDCADRKTKAAIERLCQQIVPFPKRSPRRRKSPRVLRRLRAVVARA